MNSHPHPSSTLLTHTHSPYTPSHVSITHRHVHCFGMLLLLEHVPEHLPCSLCTSQQPETRQQRSPSSLVIGQQSGIHSSSLNGCTRMEQIVQMDNLTCESQNVVCLRCFVVGSSQQLRTSHFTEYNFQCGACGLILLSTAKREHHIMSEACTILPSLPLHQGYEHIGELFKLNCNRN